VLCLRENKSASEIMQRDYMLYRSDCSCVVRTFASCLVTLIACEPRYSQKLNMGGGGVYTLAPPLIEKEQFGKTETGASTATGGTLYTCHPRCLLPVSPSATPSLRCLHLLGRPLRHQQKGDHRRSCHRPQRLGQSLSRHHL
jgi:hypothetical protein